MKEVLVHIDDDLTSSSILDALKKVVLGKDVKVQITLLEIYLVSNITNINAIEENDRIKAHLGKKIEQIKVDLEESFLGDKLVVKSKIEIGSKLNVLPNLIDQYDYDFLVIGFKSVNLIPKIKDILHEEKSVFPHVILCPETITNSIIEA
jgi:hypothetical protein